MTEKQFQEIRQDFYEERTKILNLKGLEYADDRDRLGNFRRGFERAGVLPETVCFIYMQKHFDAIATYVRSWQAGHLSGHRPKMQESIRGRLMDLANYVEFLDALIKDEMQQIVATTGAWPPHGNVIKGDKDVC